MKKNGSVKFLRYMRNLFFLLLISVSSVWAKDVYSQRAQKMFSVKSGTIESIFKQIKRQSLYEFFYNTTEVDVTEKVSLIQTEGTLNEILEQVLRNKYNYSIKDNYILISQKKIAQSDEIKKITVKGLVKDKGGEVLPGVTVLLKGTSIGVTTDMKGEFTLTVPEADSIVLRFSFIGMKQKDVVYKLQDKSIVVVLEDDVTEVDEVVVTGYQTIRKKDIVGSHTTVRAADVMMPAYSTIDQMLQGQVAGLMVLNSSARVGTTPKITIRGTSTLLGNTDPLWVVDGIIQSDNLPFDISSSMTEDLTTMLGNQISWLNPNDIETITVLKDAAATAVYGAKASNGVIVITTKKGGKDGRVSVNYSHNSSLRLAPRYKDFNFMNSQERIEFAQEAFAAGLRYLTMPIKDHATYEGLLMSYLDHTISESTFYEEVKKLETGNTDWLDLLTRDAYSQSHNLSVGGGTNKISYNISIGYTDEKGVEKGNNSRSMSGRVNVMAMPHPRITVAANITASSMKTDGYGPGVNPLSYATSTSRAIRAFDDKGEYAFYLKETNYKHVENGTYLKYNILNEINNTSSLLRVDNVNASLNFNWKLTDWLEYQFVGGYAYAKRYNETYANEKSFYIANKYRGYDWGSVTANSAEFKAAILPYGGELLTSDGDTRSYDIQNKLLFNRTFADLHRVTAMVGFQVRSSDNVNRSSTIWGYSAERGETVTPPTTPDQFASPTPQFGVNDWGIFQEMYNGTAWRNNSRKDNYLSVFLTAAYTYNNRYVFNFSMRTDASNRFGQDHNNRFDPTYSLGVSWNVAEESLIRDNISWLDQLNLRFSFGLQGNVVNNVSPDLILSYAGVRPPYNEEASAISSLPNPYLKYESTKSFNYGVDLQLFRGITMVLEYYTRETNAIVDQKLSQENGIESFHVNGGIITNKGIEYTLNFTPFSRENFAWTVGLNASKNWNELVAKRREISPSELRRAYLAGDNANVRPGYPIDGFWSYDFAGLDPETGAPTFNKLDITSEEYSGDPADLLVYSGEKTPYFTGGINTRLRYKSFSLGADFALLLGSKMRLPNPHESVAFGLPDPILNLTKDLTKRWKKTGDEKYTSIPGLPIGKAYTQAMTMPDNAMVTPLNAWAQSDALVVDASFFRCRQIMLTWNAARNICKKLGVSSLSVNGVMNNVFVIANKRLNGFDPELGGKEVQPRIFSLGVSVGL